MNRIVVSLAAFLLAFPAYATGEIVGIMTMSDWARLANHSVARNEAVAQARAAGAPQDVATLEKILARKHLPISDFDLSGNWQCRVTKVGGIADLVIYSWFRCHVSDDGSGWRLTKLTGSQRTTGVFFTDSDTRLTYLGSGSVNDDAAPPYGSGPQSDEAGYAFRTGRNAWHIEFPFPHYESRLDILELRR